MSKNGGAAGNEGSSSNAESPRSRSAVENAPRGRGAAPRPRPAPAVTPPPVSEAPPPQAPHWPSPPGSSAGRGLVGGHAAPVGSSGAVAAGAVGVGGSPPGRKRGREDGEAGAAAEAGGGGGEHRCSLCPNVYQSIRALFGHMRSHPDRGWKGVYPPPAFSAAEEFADLRVDHPPEAADDGAAAPDAGEAEKNYRVPDLNRSPPPDDDA